MRWTPNYRNKGASKKVRFFENFFKKFSKKKIASRQGAGGAEREDAKQFFWGNLSSRLEFPHNNWCFSTRCLMQFSFCHKITKIGWFRVCYGRSVDSKLLTKELAIMFFKEFLYPFSGNTVRVVLQVKEESISFIIYVFRLTPCPGSPGFFDGICF